MKKIILASIFATFALVGCGGGNKESVATDDPNKVYEVKFAHVVSANTPKGRAADFFAKRVNEMTDGRIVVHVFPSAQLVDDDKVFQELKRNNVQLAAPSFSKFTPFAKEFNLWDIPFIFRDTEHLHKVMDGEVGQILKDVVTAKGYVALDYWDAGFKQFSTNKKPIVLPSDVEGQKMRIMSSKVLEEQTKAVKGIPQVLPFGEVYSALQTGVVDAAENPLSNLYNSKFYEVQSSITMSNHGYLGYLVVASEKFWNELPKDLQEKFVAAMKEATAYEREESAKEEAMLLDKLKADDKTGTQIFELTEDQKQQWKDVMVAIYPKFYDLVSQELIEKTINTK
ncbi:MULTISPECIES: DctP family TRAP transporter solute-binding subunit [unclassified Helicobacter]|uniref:DctP family TRAP transporter solute-binding subunit n=1 Tax=unclassified Helicobacter TaxID=2593540 RepID=UPI000DCB9B88|nr:MULTISPECIES: DctP family TRAP transporter solute-binding subunit [unclassified Helicobacter]MCI2236095.1 DctP family TRAP transporter solute-binding subunit [Helicobacter sp. CaF467b]RAX53464.1 C4-dicarboxylate ABC transporter [Helicobacter sp. 11-8110]